MKVVFFTNEFPPNIYGGAGVHVDYLTRELSKFIDVEVRCFGDQHETKGKLTAKGHAPREFACSDPRFAKAMDAMGRNLGMACNIKGADIVHCHTWYAHFAGLVAKQLYGVPMVLTTHSFEPSRPWKVEQLGRAYNLSSWIERMAMEQCDGIIAVSEEMKKDAQKYFNVPAKKIDVIHNGIDLDEYRYVDSIDALKKYGVDPKVPYVLFVGRITRQKGIIHLVRAIKDIDKSAGVVLCAGAPDTPEISAEMRQAVEEAHEHDLPHGLPHPGPPLTKGRGRIVWIEEMVSKKDVIELYSHATVFCCPSVYEPFGIINLEAMACRTAVVASKVGGIPEIIVDGKTGYLVDYTAESESSTEPKDPAKFSKDLAAKINELLRDEKKRTAFEIAGRKRVEGVFSWKSIAIKTVDYYRRLTGEAA